MLDLNDIRDQVYCGDCFDVLRSFPSNIVQCCVTSPPYWQLRDYGVEGQIGLEPTPAKYVAKLVEVFREVRRVLRPDGTLWLTLADSYASAGMRAEGLKPKDLIGIPYMVVSALRADGWWLRSDIIWAKSRCRPEAVVDRPTNNYEHVFLLAKSEHYYYDGVAIQEPLAKTNAQRTTAHYNTAKRYGANNGGNTGLDALAAKMREGALLGKNRRAVWHINPYPVSGAHFATMPSKLAETCILAGTPTHGCCSACGTPRKKARDKGSPCSSCKEITPGRPSLVLDPFAGSGTTLAVAKLLRRDFVGVELNSTYMSLIEKRLSAPLGQAHEAEVFDLLETLTQE